MISDKVISILEFEKILNYISKYASTELGKQKLKHLTPYNQKSEALKIGKFINEAKEALIQNDIPPLEFLPDLRPSLANSKIEGAVLLIKQVKEINSLATLSRKVKKYLSTACEETKIHSKSRLKEYLLSQVI